MLLAVVAAAAWALRRSLFGRQILAVGGNERAARLAGVPVKRVKRSVYAVSGFCGGVAGLVVIAINSSSDANLVGSGMELDAIAAVAVGGTLLSGGRATVVGTLIGACIIQLVRYHPARQRRAGRRGPRRQGAADRAGRVAPAPRGAGMMPVSASARAPRQPYGVIVALALLIAFGALRYDRFLGPYNVHSVLRLQFHVRAGEPRHGLRHHDGRHRPVGRRRGGPGERGRGLAQPLRLVAGLAGGVAAGLLRRLALGPRCITRLKIAALHRDARHDAGGRGHGAAARRTTSRCRPPTTAAFTDLGQGDLFRLPRWIAARPGSGRSRLFVPAGLDGSLDGATAFGRTVLAVGGNEEATRLMGLPTDRTEMDRSIAARGALSGLAGVILAAQFGAGQPIEGSGWELFAISAVVVGGTPLSGGNGSVLTTLAGVRAARPHLQHPQFRERHRL